MSVRAFGWGEGGVGEVRPGDFLSEDRGEHGVHSPEGEADILFEGSILSGIGLSAIESEDGEADPGHSGEANGQEEGEEEPD